MINNLAKMPWWPILEKQIKKIYKNSLITDPKKSKVKLPSGKSLIVETSWYDFLVIDGAEKMDSFRYNRSIELPMKNLKNMHLIELKYSAKEEKGSFGAFTVGEWITAYLSLRKPSYSYDIYFVRGKGLNAKIDVLPINQEALEDMLLYPQFKLYFSSWFLDYLSPKERIKRERKNVNFVLSRFIDSFKETLYSVVENSTFNQKAKIKKETRQAIE